MLIKWKLHTIIEIVSACIFIDLKCIYLDAMLWEKVGGQFCNICDLPPKNHRLLRQLLEVDAVIVTRTVSSVTEFVKKAHSNN
jgi:hypothetical protein